MFSNNLVKTTISHGSRVVIRRLRRNKVAVRWLLEGICIEMLTRGRQSNIKHVFFTSVRFHRMELAQNFSFRAT